MKGCGTGAHNKSLLCRGNPNTQFAKGNTYASAATMPPEAHKRRMAGLMKAWERRRLQQDEGKRLVTARSKTRRQRKLRRTVARKIEEIQLMAAQHAEEAVVRMAEIVNNRAAADSAAIAAAQLLFDRAYGKPNQTNINANVNANVKPSEATASELDKRIASTLKRVEELTGRAPKKTTRPPRPTHIREPDRDTDSSTGSGTKH